MVGTWERGRGKNSHEEKDCAPEVEEDSLLLLLVYCRVFCSHFHGLFVSDFFLCTTHTRKRDDAKVRFSLFLREKKKSPSGVKIRLQLRRWRYSTFFFFFPAGFIKHEREQQRAGIKSHD